jgi:hypothetical protein
LVRSHTNRACIQCKSRDPKDIHNWYRIISIVDIEHEVIKLYKRCTIILRISLVENSIVVTCEHKITGNGIGDIQSASKMSSHCAC